MDLSRCRTDLPILLLYDVDPDWSPDTIESSLQLADKLYDGLISLGHPVEQVRVYNDALELLLKEYDPDKFIVFNWCEGLPGKPNSYYLVAQILENMGFVYTGADAQALAFSQDKRRVKKRLNDHHVPTPVWEIFDAAKANGWGLFPAIVKPAMEHCSYGITCDSLVWSTDELLQRVQYILDTFHQPALVEELIDGREFHVTVIGNGRLRVLPPAEMDFSAFPQPEDRLCTYEAKFEPSSPAYNLIELKLPAPLSPEQLAVLEAESLAAYRVTECRDYARLDIRLRDDTFYVLDINHNADFSPDTSTALAAEFAGISYPQLGSLMVNLAAQRHPGFRKL